MKTDLLLLILLIPFMFVVGCRKNNNGNGEVQDTIATNMPADTVSTIEENVEVTKSSSWEDLMPQSERNLIDVLKKAWEKDELDYTDAEKYRLVRERKNVISNGYQMTDWIGTVKSVQYYPNANEIELEISLHEGKDMRHYIRVGTGASKDLKVNRTRIIQKLPHTIREGSSLFDIALDLEPGNTVKFTGTFSLESYQWSVYENPLDDIESLAFRTKFSKLEKLD
ncbi:MAG: hypothetical protein PHU60_08910 [Tissierellia bacterium]|jgi:hypothetical protein|nr:hypothetical protein [Tissierellia bacterium]